MKKLSAALIVALLLTWLLTACGGNYPELELPDVSTLETVHAVCEDVRFDYPDEKWELTSRDPGGRPFKN